MKNFHNKFGFKFSLVLAAAVCFNFTWPVLAQQEETAEAADQQQDRVFNLTLQGRDITIGGEGAFLEESPAPRASGRPLQINPNPYLDPAKFARESFRLAQQEEELSEPGGKTSPLEQTELDPLNLDAIGLLAASGEGYPINLWQGSHIDDLLGLMSELPGGTSSPTANAMKRRLMLSSAPFPVEPDNAFGIENLLYQRLRHLYRAGDVTSLLSLFEQIPGSERSARISRLMVDAYLLDGDMESACALARAGQRDEGSADWLKINAICLVLEGEEGQARFNLTLLGETGDLDYSYQNLFEDVVKLAGEEQGEISTLAMEEGGADKSTFFSGQFFLQSDLTPLHVAILKLLGRDIDIALEEDAASNILLASLARWSGLTLETKLQVADQALKRGILEEQFLINLVGAYTFSAQDKETAYFLDYESWGVKSDALFYGGIRILNAGIIGNIEYGYRLAILKAQ